LLVVSATVGVAVWIPPIIEQLQSGRGNFSELWDFWTSTHSSMPGLVTGARIVGPQFGVAPPFVTGHESVNTFTAGVDPHWTVPVALVLLLGATAVAWVRRDRVSFAIDVVALVVGGAAWVSVARVVDTPFFYVVRWVWIVGAVTWLAIGWTAARAVSARLSSARVGAVAAAAAAVAVATLLFLVAAATVAATRATPRDSVNAALLRRMAGPALARADHGRGPVLVTSERRFLSVELSRGLLLAFARAGIDAAGPLREADAVGSNRVIAPERARRTIVVATEDDEIARYAGDPSFRVVTRVDLLTPAERAEYEAQARAIAATYSHLATWSRDHQDILARQRALAPRAFRAVVFERVCGSSTAEC
jgi:hypothetical protein